MFGFKPSCGGGRFRFFVKLTVKRRSANNNLWTTFGLFSRFAASSRRCTQPPLPSCTISVFQTESFQWIPCHVNKYIFSLNFNDGQHCKGSASPGVSQKHAKRYPVNKWKGAWRAEINESKSGRPWRQNSRTYLMPPRRLCAAVNGEPFSPPCRPGSFPKLVWGTCFSFFCPHTCRTGICLSSSAWSRWGLQLPRMEMYPLWRMLAAGAPNRQT